MYTDLYDEFPHNLERVERKLVSSSYRDGDKYDWAVTGLFKGFVDTPTTSEQLKYHQMDIQFDRALYTRYTVSLSKVDRVRYEGEVYELIGAQEDQGGQHEINRVLMRRLRNGEY